MEEGLEKEKCIRSNLNPKFAVGDICRIKDGGACYSGNNDPWETGYEGSYKSYPYPVTIVNIIPYSGMYRELVYEIEYSNTWVKNQRCRIGVLVLGTKKIYIY